MCKSGGGRLGPDTDRVSHPGLEIRGPSLRLGVLGDAEPDTQGLESGVAASRGEGGSDVGGESAGDLVGLKRHMLADTAYAV